MEQNTTNIIYYSERIMVWRFYTFIARSLSVVCSLSLTLALSLPIPSFLSQRIRTDYQMTNIKNKEATVHKYTPPLMKMYNNKRMSFALFSLKTSIENNDKVRGEKSACFTTARYISTERCDLLMICVLFLCLFAFNVENVRGKKSNGRNNSVIEKYDQHGLATE